MKSMALLFLFCCGLAQLPGIAPASRAQVFAIEILDFGMYTATRTRMIPDPAAPGGVQGRAVDFKLERQTDTIPGQIGRFFGFQFRVADPALLGKDLTLRILHPRLTEPSGRSLTEISRVLPAGAPGQIEVHMYGFDHAWEMAEGDWTFQVMRGGAVLVEKTLRVVVLKN